MVVVQNRYFQEKVLFLRAQVEKLLGKINDIAGGIKASPNLVNLPWRDKMNAVTFNWNGFKIYVVVSAAFNKQKNFIVIVSMRNGAVVMRLSLQGFYFKSDFTLRIAVYFMSRNCWHGCKNGKHDFAYEI